MYMVNNLCRVETQNEEIQPVVSYDPSSSVFMSSPDILNKLYLYSHLDTKHGKMVTLRREFQR